MSKKPQIHKRVVLFFMKEVLTAYDKKHITLSEGLSSLNLSRSHFFRYLKLYRSDPDQFGMKSDLKKKKNRLPKNRLSSETEKEIAEIIRAEKKLIDNPNFKKIKKFNFTALSDDLCRYKAIVVSAETIRRRAIAMNLHVPKSKQVKIYREVETSKIGRLFQHDTCVHQWSPFLNPFYLILTVDDHSRKIVCARFFAEESSMNHILALRDTIQKFGIPLAYYTDRHSIFIYNHRKDSQHRTYQIKVEDAEVQWKRVLEKLKIQHIIASSPQAKGKVESKFKYLQGRMVRRCAKEEVTTIEHAQRILDEEVMYYNEYRNHEITNQVPQKRWEKAEKENRNLMRPFVLEKEQSWKDIFCLEYKRKIDTYGYIRIKNNKIKLKKCPSQEVIVRLLSENGQKEIRIFSKGNLIKVIQI